MAMEEIHVKVKVVTSGGILIGKMTKPKNIRTLDALNLKTDFFALTGVESGGHAGAIAAFLAVNKRQVVSVEEVS